MRIIRIHHVTLAVRDADAAAGTFASLLGADLPTGGVVSVDEFGALTRDVLLGEDTLQLAAPSDAETPLMRFLERRDEGFYSIALEVDDLDGAVAELAARGVRVSAPVTAPPGLRSAFVTMAATHGLSVQLVQPVGDALPDRAASGAAGATGEDQADETRIDGPAASQPPAPAPLDLTPDEWSDVD